VEQKKIKNKIRTSEESRKSNPPGKSVRARWPAVKKVNNQTHLQGFAFARDVLRRVRFGVAEGIDEALILRRNCRNHAGVSLIGAAWISSYIVPFRNQRRRVTRTAAFVGESDEALAQRTPRQAAESSQSELQSEPDLRPTSTEDRMARCSFIDRNSELDKSSL